MISEDHATLKTEDSAVITGINYILTDIHFAM